MSAFGLKHLLNGKPMPEYFSVVKLGLTNLEYWYSFTAFVRNSILELKLSRPLPKPNCFCKSNHFCRPFYYSFSCTYNILKIPLFMLLAFVLIILLVVGCTICIEIPNCLLRKLSPMWNDPWLSRLRYFWAWLSILLWRLLFTICTGTYINSLYNLPSWWSAN